MSRFSSEVLVSRSFNPGPGCKYLCGIYESLVLFMIKVRYKNLLTFYTGTTCLIVFKCTSVVGCPVSNITSFTPA